MIPPFYIPRGRPLWLLCTGSLANRLQLSLFEIRVKHRRYSPTELADMSGPSRTARYGHELGSRVEYTPEFLNESDFGIGSIVYRLPKDPNYDPEEDEGYVRLLPLVKPMPPVPHGASLDKALRIYKRCEAGWHKSTPARN